MPSPSYGVRNLNPLTDLKLDPYNPRLTLEEEGSTQEALIEIMVTRFKIEELAEAIIAAGYLTFDPLIGYEQDSSVFILEGNRRVAAIKLLLQPDIAPTRYRARWVALSERLPEAHRDAMQQVPVQVYGDRDDVDLKAYIGFRHVTGVLQWPAYEKASFIAHLVDREMTYGEIADRLGSYPLHVKRHYVAYRLVRQAVDLGIPGAREMEASFGVLLRSLQAAGVSEFVGISYPDNPADSIRPVPEGQQQQLSEFVKWTFGTEETHRVLPDSRRLTQWGRILRSPEALRYLRSTPSPSFDRAWLKCGGQAESLAEALWTASLRLEEGVPLVFDHRNNEEIRKAVRECALYMAQILQHFPELRAEFGIGLHDA